jgi:lipopolysaccharide export system protein LptC
MLNRWGGWFILISFAIATTWLVQSLEEDLFVSENVASHIPDYTLDDFESTSMDAHGQLKNRLTAKTMTHYPNANANLTAPDMVFYKEKRPIWTIRAENGEVSPDGNQIWLLGNTTLQRHPQTQQQPLKMISRDVFVQVDTEYAETAAPSTIYHNHGETNSIGMRVFMPTEQIELLSTVRGHYVQP